MVIQATTSPVYPNAPPPLTCRPRSSALQGSDGGSGSTTSESTATSSTGAFTGCWDVQTGKEHTFFPYQNSFGRTDTEGCCYWGRGALHTRGVCNIGKLNYYLGKKAFQEGRNGSNGKVLYPETDFCSFPEAICAGPQSRQMRWITSMFEWTDRIQTYDYETQTEGWNYYRRLKEFVDGGYIDFEFVNEVSAIVNRGCHNPPCRNSAPDTNGGYGYGSQVHLQEDRLDHFKTVLVALERPGEKALIRASTKYLTDYQEEINGQILLSQTPQGQLYPSYRYQLNDFLSALTTITNGDTHGIGGRKFYLGEPFVPQGIRYGIVNIVMFLAQSYKESIQYDACDENNWELINDRFPLSNSCGQLNMSYQDMSCPSDEAFMECPVVVEMEQYALTNAGWFQAPSPLKCGPRSKFEKTGFWDYGQGREDNGDAYANARGRVDVEG